jgi:TonB family protein
MLKCLRFSAAWSCVVPLFIFCLRVQGVCQQGSPGSISSPPDPKELLLLAAQANGLTGPNLTPWHIKISFESMDGHGSPSSKGTFEEFWAGPSKYKRIFATSNFNQVEYLTDAGIRRTGSPDSAPSELMTIVDQFLNPIPLDKDSIDAANLQIAKPSVGETKLLCVTVSQPRRTTEPASAIQARLTAEVISTESYCTDEQSPILRLQLAGGGISKFLRNSVVRFQDRYLPEVIEEYEGSSPAPKPMLTAKLEKVEAITSIDEALFTPPPDAMSPAKVITLSERETKPQRLHHPFPEYDYRYPGENRSVHLAGIIIISLRVQTDGHVSNLRVERVAGPRELQQASLDALRKWTYKPFIRNREPVEVDTEVTLVYSLTP